MDSSKKPDQSELTPAPLPKNALEEEQTRLEQKAAQHIVEQGKNRPTGALPKEDDVSALSNSVELPFGTKLGSAVSYTMLPKHLRETAQNAPLWRIEFHGLTREAGPAGYDIVGDTVLGRGSAGDDAPDLDMEAFGAFEYGVSRRHAMLRPSRNSLYLIDLNSTNGTWHNALRVGSGITRALAHNDSITLGRLTFTIKIIDRPEREQNSPGKSTTTEVKTAPLDQMQKVRPDAEPQKTEQKDSTPIPGEMSVRKVDGQPVIVANSAPASAGLSEASSADQPAAAKATDDLEPPTITPLPATAAPPRTDQVAEQIADNKLPKTAKKNADGKVKSDNQPTDDQSPKDHKPPESDSKPKP